MKKYLLMIVLLVSSALNLLAQQEEVTGKVLDAQGEPLIGVNVTIKDASSLGSITNVDGVYKIKVKPYQTLVFSYIGYQNVEVLFKDNNKTINVQMKEEKVNAIDEVVVTGLGTQKKLTVSGAVTNVNMEDLKHQSTSSISNTLAGNVPGIIAMQTSGQPGKSTSEFWVRGISTFGASNSAYILVDGFERSNIDDLNIEDIESFTVLKDASETAIYGSKGANGVILITTKHGKEGKVHVFGKVEGSINGRTRTPEFVDGVTYANLMNEAYQTRNIGTAYTPQEIELIRSGLDPDIYPNVDWKKVMLKNTAGSFRANLNLSGGGSTARYYASIAYTEDDGMYKTDKTLRDQYNTNANYHRWNYRLNVDINLTPSTLLQLGVTGELTKRNSPGEGDQQAWDSFFGYNPLYIPLLYSDGRVPARMGANDHQWLNPWVEATQSGYNEDWNNNIQTNATLEQNLDFITKGLHLTARFGYDTYNGNSIQKRCAPEMWYANGRDAATGLINWVKISDKVEMHQSSSNWGSRREFFEARLNWDRQFFKVHNVGATVRYTQDSNISTQNLGSDIKNSIPKRNQNLAGQVSYNYALRYFFNWNFGYNGSENFARHHQYGFFPAWSVAWNIGEEPWVKKHFEWLDMFKVRYSDGKVGNDNLGNTRFPFLYTIGSMGNGYNWGSNAYPNSYGSLAYTSISSANVTWEIAKKRDAGIDLSLFHNKFSLTMDYFHEKRTGIYMVRNYLPQIVGLQGLKPSANVGATKNEGFDGHFAYHDKIGQVDLTVRGNITYAKNTILEKDEENHTYPYQYERGRRVGQKMGLIALGLFKDYDDIRNSPKQQFGTVQPGDIKYKDVNGDGVVDGNDIVKLGATAIPCLIYGVGFSARWKGFDVNMLFQGDGKVSLGMWGKSVLAFSEGKWGNIFKGITDDRWISHEISGTYATENPNASYPRLSYGGNSNNQQGSTYWTRDGKYLRLKNLDIGYTLPKMWVTAMHLTNVRFYITGANLLTWTSFKYWDPEVGEGEGKNYPLAKSVTFGVTLNL